MGPRVPSSSVRAGVAVWLTAAVALVLSACSSGSTGEADLVNGKQQFAAKCGSCHVLSRAESKGTVGPNLDQAFQQSLKDGFPRSGIRGVIYEQILHPSTFEHEGDKRVD